MSNGDFQTYFHRRARRFSSFYASEPVARALGRGPMFDRLDGAIAMCVAQSAGHVLDIGCGSGPLFAPLAERGIRVTGIEPADNMVALANAQAEAFPGLVTVQQRGWEDLDEVDAYDVAVALGVFDYVADPAELLRRMGKAAPVAIASFPSPGLRTDLRRVRYGMRGVAVHGYPVDGYDDLAGRAGMVVSEQKPLGKAGFLVRFARRPTSDGPTG
ncbi:MAG: class I SAM-dependent methyltransferase [Acidimicrobiales bacterium]|jgi:SAM-dependent methyltransferase